MTITELTDQMPTLVQAKLDGGADIKQLTITTIDELLGITTGLGTPPLPAIRSAVAGLDMGIPDVVAKIAGLVNVSMRSAIARSLGQQGVADLVAARWA